MKLLKIKFKSILILTLIGAILFTYISTFFYQEELAVTTGGVFTREDAVRMKIDTEVYRGWPSAMYLWDLEPLKVNSPLELIGYIPAYIFSFTIIYLSILPNLLFWGFISAILVIMFYSIKGFLYFKKK